MADERPDWNFEAPARETPAAFPAEPVVERAPIDGHGRVVRQDWSHDTPARNDPPFPDAPGPDDGKPTFTAEDLAHLEPADIEVDEAPAAAPATPVVGGLDAEEVAEFRAKL